MSADLFRSRRPVGLNKGQDAPTGPAHGQETTMHREGKGIRVRRRGRAAIVALAVAAAGLGAGAVPSHGALYAVEQCNGMQPGVAGWTPSYSGTYVSTADGCASGGMLTASLDENHAHVAGDAAWWTFTAPPHTSIDGLAASRRLLQSGPSHPAGYGDSYAQVLADGRVLEQCVQLGGCPVADGPAAYDAGRAQSLTFRVICTGANGCPAGPVNAALRGIRVTLEDVNDPVVTERSGSLTSESATSRHRELVLGASDVGGGVFRRTLIVDGAARPAVEIDKNGGACTLPFTVKAPCKPNVNETIPFDTAALADGHHTVAVRVTDATDVNAAQTATWPILVDNLPPTFTGPEVLGRAAQVGERLACAIASLSGQTPEVRHRWYRSNPDGSGAVPIDGATDSSYTPVEGDVGKKVLCEVTATDKGGTATRISATTSGPFAEGAVVEPAPAAPTAPAPEPACPEIPTGRGTAPSQDHDGDGIPNCADADDDNDGTPDTRDEAPFDATFPRPVPQSAPPSPPVAASAPSPAPATVVPVLRLGRDSSEKVRRRSSWRKSGFTLKGRLTSATGAPLAGIPIVATETIGKRTRELTRTVSAVDGSWRITVPRGPSRTVVVRATDGVNSATITATQKVKAQVSFRATRRKLRRGGSVLFRGRLHGGRTNTREKLVEFQVHYRGAWRSITTLRVDRKGRFRVRYRFGRRSVGRYRFRARTLPTDSYPFAVGTSSTRRSTVRVG